MTLSRVMAIVAGLCTIAAAVLLAVTLATADDHRYAPRSGAPSTASRTSSAKDYGSLGYGYGYAFAQDNLCVLASRVVTLRGERSRYFGAERPMSDDPFSHDVTHTTSRATSITRAYGGLGRRAAAAHPAGAAGPDARAAPAGRRLRRRIQPLPGATPAWRHLPDPTCRGKAWVGPITATDVWNDLLDLNRLAGAASSRRPSSAEPAGERRARDRCRTPSRRARRPAATAGRWAARRPAIGDGMLLADPHWPWTGPPLLPGAPDHPRRVRRLGRQPLRHAGRRDRPHARPGLDPHRLTARRSPSSSSTSCGQAVPATWWTADRADGQQTVSVTVRRAGRRALDQARTLYTSRYGPVLADGLDGQDRLRARRRQRRQPAIDERMAGDGQRREPRPAPRRPGHLPGHPLHPHARHRCRRDGVLRRRVRRPPRHRREGEPLHRTLASPSTPEAYVLDGSSSSCHLGQGPRRRSSPASSGRPRTSRS